MFVSISSFTNAIFSPQSEVILFCSRFSALACHAPDQFPTAWTAEAGCDVSVVLTSFRDEVTDIKYHDIALVVAHGWAKRLTLEAADSLFEQIKASIVSAPELEDLEEWIRPDGKPLLPRRAVWRHRNEEAGRKLVRPVVERAVKLWAG